MNAHDLLALQDLDSAITSIANRRPRLPELAARNAAEADVQRLRARVEAAQRRIDEAQAVIDRSEHENAELVAKKTRLQAQLKTIISPREAEALMHQIEGLDAQIRELDDTELAALDAQAEADGERASLEAELPVVRLALETATAAWSSVDAALAEESATLQERRTAAAAAIPAGDLGTYETSRRHHDGVAIARLEGVIADSATPSAEVWYRIGLAQYRAGRLEPALAAARKAIERGGSEPKEPWQLLLLQIH